MSVRKVKSYAGSGDIAGSGRKNCPRQKIIILVKDTCLMPSAIEVSMSILPLSLVATADCYRSSPRRSRTIILATTIGPRRCWRTGSGLSHSQSRPTPDTLPALPVSNTKQNVTTWFAKTSATAKQITALSQLSHPVKTSISPSVFFLQPCPDRRMRTARLNIFKRSTTVYLLLYPDVPPHTRSRSVPYPRFMKPLFTSLTLDAS